MRNEKQNWRDFDSARAILLSQTNWTQMTNSGLDEKSKVKWQEWRDQLTSISKNDNTVDEAFLKLTGLRKQLPDLQYPDNIKNLIITNNVDRETIKDIVKEVLAETDAPPTIIGDLATSKGIAQKELKKYYRQKIKAVSPPMETFHLYVERLNQAIDYLSNNGKNFPLLEVLCNNTKKTQTEVATDILKTHSVIIAKFVDIDDSYLKALKALNESVTIDELQKVLDNFNGH